MSLDATAQPFFTAGSIRGSRVLSRLEGSAAQAGEPAAAPSPVLLLDDGSSASRRAIRHAGALFAGAPALVVCLWEPAPSALLAGTAAPGALVQVVELAAELDAAAAARAERVAADGAAVAGEVGFAAPSLAVSAAGPLWRSVIDLAQAERARAVVLGARGRSCANALLAGSLSHEVIHRCPCPVVVIGPHGIGPAVAPRPDWLTVEGTCEREEESREPHPALV